jgi:hypothetical protein
MTKASKRTGKPRAPAAPQDGNRVAATRDDGRKVGTRFGTPPPRPSRHAQPVDSPSEVGAQAGAGSRLEQPAGDGTYQRSGDREAPLGGIGDDED